MKEITEKNLMILAEIFSGRDAAGLRSIMANIIVIP